MKKLLFALAFISVGQCLLADGAIDVGVERNLECDEHYFSMIRLKIKRPEPVPFTINALGGKVEFSSGNLQYQPSTNTFRFATRQWEFVGNGVKTTGVKWDSIGLDDKTYSVNSNNLLISKKYGGWIDVFGWGTSGFVRAKVDNKDPYVCNVFAYSTSTKTINTTYNYYGYGPSYNLTGVTQNIDTTNSISRNYDWGQFNHIYCKWVGYDTTRAVPTGRDSIVFDSTYFRAGTWRTLTNSEWNYLLNTRRIERARELSWALVTLTGVGVEDPGLTGLLIFPDDFELSEAKKVGYDRTATINYGFKATRTSLTLQNFQALEKLGVVFLPLEGVSDYYTFNATSSTLTCSYWSATASSVQNAYVIKGEKTRCTQNYVRLVSDIPRYVLHPRSVFR